MNGVHDMGGEQGMGPIQYEKDEPVFHARWEGRVYRSTGHWAPGASGTSMRPVTGSSCFRRPTISA